jgi:hypothetical protein
MVEGYDKILLHSFLLRSRQYAIKYFESNFSGCYNWFFVDSIPEKFEWIK